jgi:hypothetical protein
MIDDGGNLLVACRSLVVARLRRNSYLHAYHTGKNLTRRIGYRQYERNNVQHVWTLRDSNGYSCRHGFAF